MNNKIIMLISILAIVVCTSAVAFFYRSEIEKQIGIRHVKQLEQEISSLNANKKEIDADLTIAEHTVQTLKNDLATTTGAIAEKEEKLKQIKTAMKYMDLALTPHNEQNN